MFFFKNDRLLIQELKENLDALTAQLNNLCKKHEFLQEELNDFEESSYKKLEHLESMMTILKKDISISEKKSNKKNKNEKKPYGK